MFTVVAGKFDGNEENCKYVEEFKTLDEAIVAFLQVTDYPWCRIEYKEYALSVWDRS